MTDQELLQKLAAALERTASDDLDAILSRCGEQKGSVTKMSEANSNHERKGAGKKWGRWLAAACVGLVLAGAGGGLAWQNSHAVASVVSLDVNPSIELRVNRGERVISCTALNTEAAGVLFEMDGGEDLKGVKLDVAVNAIVGALVREGYLDSISSAILISVEDKDQSRAQRLQAELVASVDGVLKTQAPGTAVLSQVLDANTPAPEYMTFDSGLSAGKASLVRKVMEMNGTIATNSTTALDQLAALSIEELNDLLEAGETRIPIGKPAAAVAAEHYAGTLALDSVVTDVDPELDEQPPHYDVEIKTAFGEFDYIVDAFTGEVLSGQKDLLNTAAPGSQGETGMPITEDQALEAAAAHCGTQYPGLDRNNILNAVVKLEWDNGRQMYDVDFVLGGYEFDYDIDAYTGAVLKWDTEYREPNTQTTNPNPNPNPKPSAPAGSEEGDIGRDAAKQAALDHAERKESEITGLKLEREWDNGRLEYEVEFWSGNTEYEYTVDGRTGAILKHEWDQHGGTGGDSSDIGADGAKNAALRHAGVSGSQATEMEVDRDWEDGRLEYEVEFKAGGMEYEYTIDGATGSILEYEQEWDD